MCTPFRNVNFDLIMKPRQVPQIEFWRDNGNHTCTRIADGLTLSYEEYANLSGRHQFVPRRNRDLWDFSN